MNQPVDFIEEKRPQFEVHCTDTLGLSTRRLPSGDYQSFGAQMAWITFCCMIKQLHAPALITVGKLDKEWSEQELEDMRRLMNEAHAGAVMVPMDDLKYGVELLVGEGYYNIPQVDRLSCILDSTPMRPFQDRTADWMSACFGPEISADVAERNHRFFEEATELVQSKGMTKEECLMLIDYTFNRAIGQPEQEVGGVLVTLAALCNAADIRLHDAGENELTRIWKFVDKIREKQRNKPRSSPLPE